MPNTLEDYQANYLQGLREGDSGKSALIIWNQIPADTQNDFDNFERFLKARGHQNPQPADLYLTVARESFLSLLHYADKRNCLILQNCFGFDQAPTAEWVDDPRYDVPPFHPILQKTVGRVVLIQKGNFQEAEGRPDSDFFSKDTVFRNADQSYELFLNMDTNHLLPTEQAKHYISHFLANYPAEGLPSSPTNVHGYLLPVKALVCLLTDSANALGSSDTLTFRWGLTSFNATGLGNFTLVIGTGEANAGMLIEFRTASITGSGTSDCPPHPGCAL